MSASESFGRASTFTGFVVASQTALISSTVRRPGAYRTSAPARSNACSRAIVSSRSGLPRMWFSARAVSVNGKSSPCACSTAAVTRSMAWPRS